MDWNNVVEAALNTVTLDLSSEIGDAHAFKRCGADGSPSGEAKLDWRKFWS